MYLLYWFFIGEKVMVYNNIYWKWIKISFRTSRPNTTKLGTKHSLTKGFYYIKLLYRLLLAVSMILIQKNSCKPLQRYQFITIYYTYHYRLAFDEDRVPDLTEEIYLQDIHCISSLLKMYFRELPNPLLTYQLYDKFAVSKIKRWHQYNQG